MPSKNSINLVTYFDKAYLTRGLALHQSLEQHCSNCHLFILALDDDTLQVLTRLGLSNVTLIPFEEFADPALVATRPTRSQVEFYWTCTPSILFHCLSKWELDSISYIDADTFFFSSPEPLYQEIANVDIAITPHRFPPHLQWRAANSGIYNLGWAYFRNTDVAIKCLMEWRRNCLDWCYNRVEADRRCGDQGYLEDWPAKYGAYPVRQKGVNLAPWNQQQYVYWKQNSTIYVDDDPLIFYHFHQGFQPKYVIDKFVLGNVYVPYRRAIDAHNLYNLPTF